MVRPQRRRRGAANEESVSERLQSRVASGEFYEASQLSLTIAHREKTKDNWDKAVGALYDGATVLLGANPPQTQMASNLALNLIELYDEAKFAPTEERLAAVEKLVRLFPNDVDEDGLSTPKLSFLRSAIEWSKTPEHNDGRGSKVLHLLCAEVYALKKDYKQAEYHMLRADCAEEHVKLVREWQKEGYGSEKDLFLARAVFQYLCLKNLKCANNFFEPFAREYDEAGGPDKSPPLINFTRFLLKVCETEGVQLFNALRQRYAPSLSRDTAFAKYLDRIAAVYWNVQPRAQGGLGGMLGNLMQGFMQPRQQQ